MKWTEVLEAQIETAYHSTLGLLDLVDEDQLEWKPETGSNWMTMGQLLMHLTQACGTPCRGYVTGDWGLPEDIPLDEMFPEGRDPTAEELPSMTSVAEVREELTADKQLTLDLIAEAGEDALASKQVAAPWDPAPQALGFRLLNMVGHLSHHKAQLFYYLKLQGKPVHTGHLWRM